ncbi:MAG: hypothetical protein FJZ08_06020 [Candidatus Omnitrophica bacterium]|nr:hypothetical protein [Candidatus Omnitrophota bacterium]
MPKEKQFFIGAQTHIILKRYLESEFGKLRSSQHFFLLSLGLSDWFCVDLKGGAGNIKQRPTDSSEIDYSSSFAGGYGFRLKLYEEDKLKMVLGFQHISVHPKKTRLGDTKHRAILDDWQASFLVSRQLSRVTPYLGLKWSRVDYIHKIEDSRKRRMSDLTKDLGMVAGLDLAFNDKAWINLEGQLFDTQAVSVSLNYSF